MKRIPAEPFKPNCRAIMDEVYSRRASLVVSKHGKAVAKLVPVNTDSDDIYNFFAGKGAVEEDVVSSALSPNK